MSDAVVICGMLCALVVALVAVIVIGRVMTRHYDAKIAESRKMKAVRESSPRRERPEPQEDDQEAPKGLDMDALGGIDGVMDVLGIPPVARAAVQGFIDHSGGVDGILGKLQKATEKGGGEWNF